MAAPTTPAGSLLGSGSLQLQSPAAADPLESLRNTAPTSQSSLAPAAVPLSAASLVRSSDLQQQHPMSLPASSVAPPLSSTLPTSLNARPLEREREKPKRESSSTASLAARLTSGPETPQSPEGGNSEASERTQDAMAHVSELGAELEQRQREMRALEELQLRRYREQLTAERVAEERRLAVEHERTIRLALLFEAYRMFISQNHLVIVDLVQSLTLCFT